VVLCCNEYLARLSGNGEKFELILALRQSFELFIVQCIHGQYDFKFFQCEVLGWNDFALERDPVVHYCDGIVQGHFLGRVSGFDHGMVVTDIIWMCQSQAHIRDFHGHGRTLPTTITVRFDSDARIHFPTTT
tara:strand:+ start:63991 stop:64386 length:396 start_codon:yes stop_codon:yes gene_type:complete